MLLTFAPQIFVRFFSKLALYLAGLFQISYILRSMYSCHFYSLCSLLIIIVSLFSTLLISLGRGLTSLIYLFTTRCLFLCEGDIYRWLGCHYYNLSQSIYRVFGQGLQWFLLCHQGFRLVQIVFSDSYRYIVFF